MLSYCQWNLKKKAKNHWVQIGNMGAALLVLTELQYRSCLAARAVLFECFGLDFTGQVIGQYCWIYVFDLEYFSMKESTREVFTK